MSGETYAGTSGSGARAGIWSAIVLLDGADASGAEDRRAGYREAMAEYGLSTQARIVPGGDAESDGLRATRALLAEDPDITAIVAYNDPYVPEIEI